VPALLPTDCSEQGCTDPYCPLHSGKSFLQVGCTVRSAGASRCQLVPFCAVLLGPLLLGHTPFVVLLTAAAPTRVCRYR
jgi:hypothetical protein